MPKYNANIWTSGVALEQLRDWIIFGPQLFTEASSQQIGCHANPEERSPTLVFRVSAVSVRERGGPKKEKREKRKRNEAIRDHEFSTNESFSSLRFLNRASCPVDRVSEFPTAICLSMTRPSNWQSNRESCLEPWTTKPSLKHKAAIVMANSNCSRSMLIISAWFRWFQWHFFHRTCMKIPASAKWKWGVNSCEGPCRSPIEPTMDKTDGLILS